MAQSSHLEGLKECREAMQELSATVQRNAGRRALRSAALLLEEAGRSRAPVSTNPRDKSPGSLKASFETVNHKGKKGSASVAVVAADVASVHQEFGTTFHPAQPFFRPAIDATEAAMISTFAAQLKPEIEQAAAKAAKRSAKAKT